MDSYPPEISACFAPLIILQGLPSSLTHHNPKQSTSDARIEIPDITSPKSCFHDFIFNNPESVTIERSIPETKGELPSIVSAAFGVHDIGDLTMPASTDKGFLREFYYHIIYASSTFHCYPPKKLNTNAKFKSPSPISPFNESSRYHDTLLPLEWIQKYRSIKPAVFISVHRISKDCNELIKDINRVKLAANSAQIKFIELLLLDEQTLDSELVEKIRIGTNLSLKSNFFILSSSNKKKVSIFVESLLRHVRIWCSDYYYGLIKNISRRTSEIDYKKSYLEARSALKNSILHLFLTVTENSTRLLETAYEHVITAIRETKIDSVSWNQCRVMLDMLNINIVRSYLILGYPGQAYKKFIIHLQNVESILPDISYSTYSWKSRQYIWFSKLFEQCPSTLAHNDLPYQIVNSVHKRYLSKRKNAVPYMILPHGGFICLKSYEYLKKRQHLSKSSKSDPKDHYLSLPYSEEKNFDYTSAATSILNDSLECFAKSKIVKFGGVESYIYFKLGEEYFADKNYSMAMNNYLVSLPTYTDENWISISSVILFKLFRCLIDLKLSKEAAIYYIKLAVLPERYLKPLLPLIDRAKLGLDQDWTASDSDKLVFKGNIFDWIFVTKKEKYAYAEPMQFQIVLSSKINSLVDHIVVKNLVIKFYGSSNTIEVKHDSSMKPSAFTAFAKNVNDNTIEVNCNMLFSSDDRTKVLQFDITSDMIGSLKFDYAKLDIETLDFDFETKLSSSLDDIGTKPIKWYRKSNESLKFDILPMNPSPFTMIHEPRQPEVEIRLDHKDFAYNGSEFSVKVAITSTDSLEYKCTFSAHAFINGKPLITNWSTDFTSIAAETGSCDNFVTMHLPYLRRLGTFNEYHRNHCSLKRDCTILTLNLEFGFTAVDDKQNHLKKMKSLKVPIFDMFRFLFTIKPSLATADDGGYKRNWKCNWLVKDVALTNLVLTNIQFNVKPLLPHSNATILLNYPSKSVNLLANDDNFLPLPFELETYCDTGHMLPSIDVACSVSFDYESKESTHPICYKLSLWKGSLPYTDARAIVDLKVIDDKTIDVNYVLDNPSNVALQLTCTLESNRYFNTSNVMSKFNVEVEPFKVKIVQNRYEISPEFSTKRLLRLPILKIYDYRYKIYMNQLVVSESIRTTDDGMFYINHNEQ